MADLNTIYNGVPDQQDPDVVIATVPDTWPWQPYKKIYLPDEVRQAIRDANDKAISTIDAVRVAYTTGTDRTQWLKDRIDAIDARVTFIRERVNNTLDYLKSIGADGYTLVEKAFTSALAALPYVEGIIAGAEAGAQAARQLEAYKAQQLVQLYAEDIKQLAQIRAALVAEYGKTTTGTTPGTDKTPAPQEAPTPTVYYWYAGAAILVLFILYLAKKRNRKRS
ncbi:hypothetical protein [Spirosoma litoris]